MQKHYIYKTLPICQFLTLMHPHTHYNVHVACKQLVGCMHARSRKNNKNYKMDLAVLTNLLQNQKVIVYDQTLCVLMQKKSQISLRNVTYVCI